MIERFIDSSTKRKKIIVKDKLRYFDNIPVFSIVEFNIYGNCNRDCSFCPVSNPEIYEKRHEGISIELFSKVIDDLVEINYQGKILFSAFSEPLLHKELEILISNAKSKLPNTRIEIVSNGDLLTVKKLKSIFDAGLDTISISMYDGDHQIDHFTQMANECGLNDSQVILRRRYLKDGNYGLTISNRSGLINSNEFRDKNEEIISELPLKSKCYYPFYMILVDYNGDVLLCPHDWSKKLKFGNLTKNSIWNIWKSKVLNSLRGRLANSDRNFNPCKSCDVLGTVIGEDSFDAWLLSGEIEK
ncbi:radical SAM/SPASM domain-containing protein [Sulfurimonas sp. HSL3-2]|uniref:radical SAM/SPASM domain-containing protein n=1 Tax=Hydrocurvibacter mobilis TaxID=3131936 RepID=UPI0031F8E5B0